MYKTMNGNKFMSINKFVNESSENSPENSSQDSPRSAVSTDNKKIASTSSSKKRRGVEKKVVSVPIKDIEGFRLKGDQMSAPPSDSWAWRKYGQKPIKGSPYPRAYYRCSSSKGCPARKQVERSKADPNMLLITYACEHNHPWPAASRSNHRTTGSVAATVAASITSSVSEEEDEEMEEEEEIQEEEKKPIVNIPTIQTQEPAPEYKFPNLPLSEFGWFTDFESTLESPLFTEDRIDTDDLDSIFTMREEDESLFADLGELPECSTVFRNGLVGRVAEQPRQSLATTS